MIFEIRSEATKLNGAKLAADLQVRLVGGRPWRQPGGSIRGVTRGNAVVAGDGRRIVTVAAFLDGATIQGDRHSAGTAAETVAVAVLKQQRSGVVPVVRRVASAAASVTL